MAKHKQYDIWLANLDPKFGTEAGKTRPVLIIQTDLLNKHHPSTVVCPLTTNIFSNATVLRHNLASGQANLKQDSAVMLDQIRAIDNKRLLKKIGHLSKDNQTVIVENLKVLLDID